MARDPFNLERFVAAQAGLHECALAELRQGRKQTHWMWFVFPQLAGLGKSEMARHYAIGSLAEARAFWGHSVLGPRLIACTRAVLTHRGTTAESVFGPVDALKFRSSMTLFEAAADDPTPFAEALDLFFNGERDQATLQRLRGQDQSDDLQVTM